MAGGATMVWRRCCHRRVVVLPPMCGDATTRMWRCCKELVKVKLTGVDNATGGVARLE
jgi:hypothetical protein